MTMSQRPRSVSIQALVLPLIVGVVGIVGVVVLSQTVPGFQTIELVLLIAVALFAVGFAQDTVRGIISLVSLYIATAVAATFYRGAAPYTGIVKRVLELPLSGIEGFTHEVELDNGTLAFSFWFLAIIIWGLFEIVSRLSFRDTTIPDLGVLDRLGGALLYLVVGVLVASLLFNALGYGQLRPYHNRAAFRSAFNQVVYVHYLSQSFWFSRNPPPLYIYDLNLSRER